MQASFQAACVLRPRLLVLGARSRPAFILSERDLERPVQVALDRPTRADRPGWNLGRIMATGQNAAQVSRRLGGAVDAADLMLTRFGGAFPAFAGGFFHA